eukprot:47747-Eustigmatos_ZCMA.PRE.1
MSQRGDLCTEIVVWLRGRGVPPSPTTTAYAAPAQDKVASKAVHILLLDLQPSKTRARGKTVYRICIN